MHVGEPKTIAEQPEAGMRTTDRLRSPRHRHRRKPPLVDVPPSDLCEHTQRAAVSTLAA